MNDYTQDQNIAREQPHRSGWTKVMYAAILIFTTMGTWEIVHLTSAVTGWALVIRQVAAVIFTDGALLYHHLHQERYPTERQRKISNIMLWESVAVVSCLTVCYMLLSVLGDAWRTEVWSIDAPGLTISATAVQWIDIVMLLFLAAQAIANLAALVRISQLSPESSQTLFEKLAEQEVITQQLRDYRTAQRAIAPIVGQERALLATQRRLEELGYTPREIALIVAEARTHISDTRALLPTTPPPPSRVVDSKAKDPAPFTTGEKCELCGASAKGSEGVNWWGDNDPGEAAPVRMCKSCAKKQIDGLPIEAHPQTKTTPRHAPIPRPWFGKRQPVTFNGNGHNKTQVVYQTESEGLPGPL